MAGNARYTAVLDACVLVPIAMTDALMSLATAGLFAAKWTTRIEMEWQSALVRIRPDIAERIKVRPDRTHIAASLGGGSSPVLQRIFLLQSAPTYSAAFEIRPIGEIA